MSKLTDRLIISHEEALDLIKRMNNGEDLSVIEMSRLNKHIDEGCEECIAIVVEVFENTNNCD